MTDTLADRLLRFFDRFRELAAALPRERIVEAARRALREFDEDEASEEKAA